MYKNTVFLIISYGVGVKLCLSPQGWNIDEYYLRTKRLGEYLVPRERK
jgi:hypothetical protein